jgi:cytochrome c biogenesis protein CcdA
MLLFILARIGGVLTVASPCILPVPTFKPTRLLSVKRLSLYEVARRKEVHDNQGSRNCDDTSA